MSPGWKMLYFIVKKLSTATALLRCLFWIHKTSSAHAPGNPSWNNNFKRVLSCPKPFSLQMCSKYYHNDRVWNDEKIIWPENPPNFQLFPTSKKIPVPTLNFFHLKSDDFLAVFSDDPPYLTTLGELGNCSCNAKRFC